MTQKPRIGLMLSFGVGGYSRHLLRGIREEAASQGCRLTVFKGNFLQTSNGFLFQENAAFLHIRPENVDILLVPTGINSTVVGKDEFERVLLGYQIPVVVSIGNDLPSFHNIVVDNKSGIRETVAHLVQKHGITKIAFMTGTPQNNEGQDRYHAYREALEEFELPFQEDWVLPASFSYFSANEILQTRFADSQPRFEALICANDEMALESISFFQKKGLRIPTDLAVTGFDDIDEASDHLPQLTTVRQPISDVGAAAVKLGLEVWKKSNRGESPLAPQQVLIPADLRVRSSCGCLAKQEARDETDTSVFPLKYAEGILEPGPKQEAFLIEFQRLAEERLLEGLDASKLQRLIFQARTGLLQRFPDRVTPRNLTDIMGSMQQIAFQLTRLIYAAGKEGLDTLFTSRYSAIEKLDSAIDLDEIATGLCRLLPQLGVESCTLVLYPQPKVIISEAELELPEEARILFSLGPGGVRTREDEQIFNPRHGCLPQPQSTETTARLLTVLYFREFQYGYFLMSMGSPRSQRYEIIRTYVKNLVQYALLYQGASQRTDRA